MIFGKYLNKYYKKYFIGFLVGIVALFLVNYIQVSIPMIIGQIIDNLEGNTNYGMTGVIKHLLNIVVIVGVIALLRIGWRMSLLTVTNKIIYHLKNDMYVALQKMSPAYFQNNKTGKLMSNFTNDIEAIDQSITWGTLMYVDFFVLTPLILINMVKSTNLRLTIYVVFPVVIFFIGVIIFRKMIKKKFEKTQKSFSELTDFVQENVSGITVIKAFNKEEYFKEEFKRHSIDYKNKSVAHLKLVSIFQNTNKTLFSLIYTILLIFGYLDYTKGLITIGDIVVMTQFVILLRWPIFALGEAIIMTSKGKVSYKRISTILSLTEDTVNSSKGAKITDETIEFKNLTFKYENNIVLDDISFKINPGEFVGIIGRTGSGKTTLLKLMLRYYNLENNSLFIGNQDIMDLNVQTVRDLFGYSPQDNFIFQKTITENIKFSSPDSTDQEVEEITKEVDFYDNIINFNNTFNTLVGERGVSLSGGQKQRLSIARALLKEAKILLLDDSLSAVDTKTEDKILKSLAKIRKNRTTIIISNRISTIKKADKIILLDKGKIVQIGTHEQLKQTSKLYKSLDDLQKLQTEYGIEGGIDE